MGPFLGGGKKHFKRMEPQSPPPTPAFSIPFPPKVKSFFHILFIHPPKELGVGKKTANVCFFFFGRPPRFFFYEKKKDKNNKAPHGFF